MISHIHIRFAYLVFSVSALEPGSSVSIGFDYHYLLCTENVGLPYRAGNFSGFQGVFGVFTGFGIVALG